MPIKKYNGAKTLRFSQGGGPTLALIPVIYLKVFTF